MLQNLLGRVGSLCHHVLGGEGTLGTSHLLFELGLLLLDLHHLLLRVLKLVQAVLVPAKPLLGKAHTWRPLTHLLWLSKLVHLLLLLRSLLLHLLLTHLLHHLVPHLIVYLWVHSLLRGHALNVGGKCFYLLLLLLLQLGLLHLLLLLNLLLLLLLLLLHLVHALSLQFQDLGHEGRILFQQCQHL